MNNIDKFLNQDPDTEEENEDQYKDSDMDISWINEFEKIDKDYESLYIDDVENIMLHFIYINKEDEIEKIQQKMFILKEKNNISREEIIGILKNHNFLNEKKYTISSILKYNIDLDPQDIRNYLTTNKTDNNTSDYLTVIKHIDDICLNKTISMFQDLNDLLIVFYENTKTKNISRDGGRSQTKKIYLEKKHAKTYKRV